MTTERMDNVFEATLKEVQAKFKAKYGKDISLKQLYIVLNIKDELTQNAIFTGKGIKLPNLGSFTITPKRSKYLTQEQVMLQDKLQTNSCLVTANSDIGY